MYLIEQIEGAFCYLEWFKSFKIISSKVLPTNTNLFITIFKTSAINLRKLTKIKVISIEAQLTLRYKRLLVKECKNIELNILLNYFSKLKPNEKTIYLIGRNLHQVYIRNKSIVKSFARLRI
jgi:hypothetical protein